MGGGGGPSITYVYVSQDKLMKAVAYCLDDKNCSAAVADAQKNDYIGNKDICGYLDITARTLIKNGTCETFENKTNSIGESFTSMIENLEKKENLDSRKNQKKI
jgi:hypothetical protein